MRVLKEIVVELETLKREGLLTRDVFLALWREAADATAPHTDQLEALAYFAEEGWLVDQSE
jgi:hypothetical protein